MKPVAPRLNKIFDFKTKTLCITLIRIIIKVFHNIFHNECIRQSESRILKQADLRQLW